MSDKTLLAAWIANLPDCTPSDLDQWLQDNTVPIVECPKCGAIHRWWDWEGKEICRGCRPPPKAGMKLMADAVRLRARYQHLIPIKEEN